MEKESILSDLNSYSGGSEIGLEDVYSRSETLLDNGALSLALEDLRHNEGILYSSIDIADVSPRDMSSHNVYHDSIEPLPAHGIVRDEPGNRYLESADHLRPLNQSSDSESDSGSIESQSNNNVDNSESSWNERFQRIYNTENSLEKYLALGKLVKDFVDTAQTYAKVIISESALPVTEKTIKPRQNIGIAGGDKYICAGVLFKYATDKELNGGLWMYGGSHRKDEFALKSANHELKGIISYLNAGVKELCLPLMAVIDYAGVRLVAVALLPINEATLRYGSNNAGRTIHNSDKKLNLYIEQVARKLNIKGHPVGLTKKVLFSPGDLEGHLGDDDRYYVLDFARLYPSEPPSERNFHERATWFNLLRPELVASNPIPLSPDAYSCFESQDTRAVSKKEIVEATVRLYKVVIPKFAKDFDDAQTSAQNSTSNSITEHGQLIESLHRAGINIRHLGFVLLKTTTQAARSIILTEMVARVIKNEIKHAFRDQSMLFSSRDKFQQIILDEMNSITATNTDKYVTFWATRVHALLKNKFQYNYADDPKNVETEIEGLVDKRVLIEKLEIMTGFKLTHAAKESFFESGTAVFREVDIKAIEPRVKHLNIVDYAEGAVYMYLAKSCGERETSRLKQYLRNAIKSFSSALSAAPFDGSSCYKLARCLHKIAELELDSQPLESLVKQASDKYAQSILFGYSPEKVLERRGQLLLMAAGRTNEEKYYRLAGESYQQAFRYPSCMHLIKDLFERAREEQGEQLLNALKLSLYCPVLQHQFSNELTRIDLSKTAAFSQVELLVLFSGLKEVKELLVPTLNINDEFIEFAANKWPGLERIDISGILNITDRGLLAVSKCTSLKYLKLDKMGLISDKGLIQLSTTCTKIEELSVCQCSQISEACMIQVTDNLPHLQHFHCIMFHELQPKMFTSKGLIHLVRPGTKTLRVSVHNLTNEAAAQLIQKINETGAKIERLALLREYDLFIDRDPEARQQLISEDAFILLFSVLPYVKSIEISNLNITDDALRFMVTNCANLEKIVVDAIRGSELSVEWLDAMTPNNSKLQRLELMSSEDEISRVPLVKQLATSCPRITTFKTESFYMPDELIAISNCFPYMQNLSLAFHRDYNVDDVVIRLCCESWRNMKKLSLKACDTVCGFVDSFLTLSKNTPNLKALSLQLLSEINPMALADFFYQPKPKITKLDLYKSTPVNDDAMAKILPLVPNLTHLNLSYTRVSNKTVHLIAQHLPKLRKLYMIGVAGLSDNAFIEVAKSLKHLRVVILAEQVSLNGGCAVYFAYHCDNLQRVSMRVSEDLYVEPSFQTSPLACTITWRAKLLFLFCKKIHGPMRLDMLKKSAELLNRVLLTMPEYLNDYQQFWLSRSDKPMDAEALHQYIYMLDYCPQIINLLQSYWQYHPNDELFTSSSLKLTRNYLVGKSTLMKVLSALNQPISLHLEDCRCFTPEEFGEVLASFQFKSLHLSNESWQLFDDAVAKLSTLSESSLLSLEVPSHYDLQALDVAKFTNLTNLDASFSIRDMTWGAGELTAILAACKRLKRIDFSGRHQASIGALTNRDAETLTLEKLRAGVGVSLADASRLLKNSTNLVDLRIRIGADGGLHNLNLANLVSLELFETNLTNDMLTALTACQHIKQFSLQQCSFGADTHDAFRLLFSSLSFNKLIMVPRNKRDLNGHVFESITQQSQLEHLEIALHPCPHWQVWTSFIEKNVSLKKFILRENSAMIHYALQKIIPLLPPLERFSGVSLDNDLFAILAQNSQKTMKELSLSSSSDLTECKALGLCRNIEVLDLSYCNIKDEDLMHVSTCLSGQLKEIKLVQCKNISSATITSLLQHCPKLRKMNLSECVQLTESLLPALEEYGHCLEELDLTRCPLLDVEKIDHLKMFSIKQLRTTRSIFEGMIEEDAKEVNVSVDNLFKALARKVCTRSLLKNYSLKQEATHCNTCQAVVCKSCLIKCHKGHEVGDEQYFSITCQCADNCKCQK